MTITNGKHSFGGDEVEQVAKLERQQLLLNRLMIGVVIVITSTCGLAILAGWFPDQKSILDGALPMLQGVVGVVLVVGACLAAWAGENARKLTKMKHLQRK